MTDVQPGCPAGVLPERVRPKAQDRHRDAEPRRAGHPGRRRAVPAGAVCRPRDHPAPIPALARPVHRPPADAQSSAAVCQHRRRVADPALYRSAGARAWWRGWTGSLPRPRRTDSTSPSATPRPAATMRFAPCMPTGSSGRWRSPSIPSSPAAPPGSSLNELWRAAERHRAAATRFDWSVIDRWPVHPGFIEAMAETVREGLAQFAPSARDEVLFLFSAHSLPLDVIDRGDPYPQEVGASVQRVVERLGASNPYLLAYQSDVGPVRWLGPSTEQVIRRLGRAGPEQRAGGARSPSPATTSRHCPSWTASTARLPTRPGSLSTCGHPP